MQKNVIFSLGNVALIDKIDSETSFFQSVLGGIGGRSRSFIPGVKLLIGSKLGKSVSINRILKFTLDELPVTLGFREKISDRNLNRFLERLGERQPVTMTGSSDGSVVKTSSIRLR